MIETRLARTEDADWIGETLVREWHGPLIERADEFIDSSQLPAIIAEENGNRIGLLTFLEQPDHLEIVTLNSFATGQGVGSILIDALETEAQLRGIHEVRLFTTNENMNALGFYQRRGFRLWCIYRDTITRAREVKKSIPLRGANGIPIWDEIELRKML